MDKSIYVAMTGAQASLQAQGAVSHNLANVDTAGFKAALSNTEAFPIKGQGYPSRIDTIMSDQGFDARLGTLRMTGNALDVALRENRWLTVQAQNGDTAYTRSGELVVNPNGQLQTRGGSSVLDENQNPITIPPHQSLEIGSDGTISIVPLGEGPQTLAMVGRIGIVDAPRERLTRGLDGLMRDIEPDAAPFPQAVGPSLTTGALEGSNVDPANALVQMIQLQRQYEMQVKVIKHGDENAQSANGLLRLRG